MAKTAQIFCKKCQERTKHWDNTGTDKEKTLGKFVCSICKNPYTPKPKGQNSQSTYQKKGYSDSVPKSMYGAWAKDIVTSFIEKGAIKTVEDSLKHFTNLVNKIGVILNKDVKPSQLAENTNAEEPASEENIEDDDLDLNLDDFEV